MVRVAAHQAHRAQQLQRQEFQVRGSCIPTGLARAPRRNQSKVMTSAKGYGMRSMHHVFHAEPECPIRAGQTVSAVHLHGSSISTSRICKCISILHDPYSIFRHEKRFYHVVRTVSYKQIRVCFRYILRTDDTHLRRFPPPWGETITRLCVAVFCGPLPIYEPGHGRHAPSAMGLGMWLSLQVQQQLPGPRLDDDRRNEPLS